jgi:prepilin-type N-terminal cleavage/methylation domain-containing protein
MKTYASRRSGGFSLIEMMITICVVALCGGMVFLFLNTGMNLYAKNTAVNVAHQQARAAVDQMLANIHGAVSIPQLVDDTLTPLPPPGTGPAVGVNFQRYEAGPFLLWNGANSNVPSTQTWVAVYAKDWAVPQTTTGLRFNLPSHEVEMDIASIIAFGDYRVINFTGPVGTDIIVQDDGSGNGKGNFPVASTSNVSAFITRRVSYAVVCTDANPAACSQPGNSNKELRYYPTNDLQNFRVIARNVTTQSPFKILLNPEGGADFRSVATVNLSTAEPQFSNRGYAAVNMFINSNIPFRSKLTINQ